MDCRTAASDGSRMKRFSIDAGIPTLEVALSECMGVEELRMLAALTREKLPTLKADIAAVIMRHLDGEGPRAVWQSLDELQHAAVAEVVHSSSTAFPADRFRAKYGRDPIWSTDDKGGYPRRPSALGFFYANGMMPSDLKRRLKEFVPPPAAAEIETLAELPAACDLPRGKGTKVVPLTVRETERPAQRGVLSILRLVDAGKVAVSDKTRRASSAAIETITSVLEGDDFYPRLPFTNKWHDENAGPIRAFAWPLLIQAGGLVRLVECAYRRKLFLTKRDRSCQGGASCPREDLIASEMEADLFRRRIAGIESCHRFPDVLADFRQVLWTLGRASRQGPAHYCESARSSVAFSRSDWTYLFIDFLLEAAFIATRRWIAGSTRTMIVPLYGFSGAFLAALQSAR